MAALLCEACFAPCRGCGRCCDDCTECCCDACDNCCKSFAACTDQCCEAMCDLCEHPFSFCGIISTIMNFFSLIFMIVLFENWDLACDNPMKEWMLVILVCFLVNLVFTVYLWKKLGYLVNGDVPRDKYGHEMTLNEQAKQFFCYDPWVAVYIIFAIFAFVWAIVGISWVGGDSAECNHSYGGAVVGAAIVLMVFFVLGILIVTFTTCCSGSECHYCLEDVDCLKCFFCYVYYPICYKGAPPDYREQREQKVKQKRALRRRELNERRVARGQPALDGYHVSYHLTTAPRGPREHEEKSSSHGGGVLSSLSSLVSGIGNSGSRTHARAPTSQLAAPQQQQARPVAAIVHRPAQQQQQQHMAVASAPPSYEVAAGKPDPMAVHKPQPTSYEAKEEPEEKSTGAKVASAAASGAKKVGGFASRLFKSGVKKLNASVNGDEAKQQSPANSNAPPPAYSENGAV